MENVESVITQYHIKRAVLEAWLKKRFPYQEITVTPKDGDYVVVAPESISQRDVKHLKDLDFYA